MPSKAKGNDRNCCCGGCGKPPIGDVTFGYPSQATQVLCLSCLPLQLCAQYVCPDDPPYPCSGIWEIANLEQTCEGTKPINNYSVNLVHQGHFLDFQLTLVADLIANTCKVCLTSTALPYDNQCVDMTDSLRKRLGNTCQTNNRCTEEFGPTDTTPLLSFNLSTGCTLNFWSANNVSIIRQPLAYGVVDPCTVLAPGFVTDPYHVDCGGPCSGCDCICQGAELVVAPMGSPAYRVGLTFCNNSFVSFGGGWQLDITAGANGCCVLNPRLLGSIRPSHALVAVPIGQLTANPCPNPSARWDFSDVQDPYHPNVTTIYFNCVNCHGSSVGVTGSQCCDGPMPRVLKAEFTFTPDCLCCDAGPVDVIFDMFWDQTQALWIGDWINPNTGSPAYAQITRVDATMSCPTGIPTLHVVVQALALDFFIPLCVYPPCGGCDPIDFTFIKAGSFAAPGVFCNGLAGPWLMTIHVTE